jgi:hypothetical protein
LTGTKSFDLGVRADLSRWLKIRRPVGSGQRPARQGAAGAVAPGGGGGGLAGEEPRVASRAPNSMEIAPK